LTWQSSGKEAPSLPKMMPCTGSGCEHSPWPKSWATWERPFGRFLIRVANSGLEAHPFDSLCASRTSAAQTTQDDGTMFVNQEGRRRSEMVISSHREVVNRL